MTPENFWRDFSAMFPGPARVKILASRAATRRELARVATSEREKSAHLHMAAAYERQAESMR